MKINIKLDQSNIKKIEQAAETSLVQLLEIMKTDINTSQVIPKETGNLEESVITLMKTKNKGVISYNTPYARRLYYHPEYNFRADKNVNAQGRWFDMYMSGDKHRWLVETYGNLVRENSGGVIK